MLRKFIWITLIEIQKSPLISTNLRVRILRFMGLDIHPTAKVQSHVHFTGKKVKLGEHSYINTHCFFQCNNGSIIIDDYVRTAPYVKFVGDSHKFRRGTIRRKAVGIDDIGESIYVGIGSWIGIGCTIMPGVSIGRGCIIGAGALVIKDACDNGFYAGFPARRIKEMATDDENSYID